MNPPSAAQKIPAAPSSITNNQEQGVDEGDIVKTVGGTLVVLRKGRLYAVSLRGALRQTDTARVARTDALDSGVWYDETLVSGDRVYVIGYRYSLPGGAAYSAHGATEINSFRLVDGRIQRLTTTFIESWDYYSGRNYASRLVDGRLVFYMPFSASMPYYAYGDGDTPAPRRPNGLRVPHRLQYDGRVGRIVDEGPLFAPGDVFRPFTTPASPVYHSVVRCALPDDGALDCAATTVLGDASREFYVSPTNVYVWSGDRVVMMGLRDGTVAAPGTGRAPGERVPEAEAIRGPSVPASTLIFYDAAARGEGAIRTVDVESGVDRIEAAGARVLVVVSGNGQLALQMYTQQAARLSQLALGSAAVRESRSHGFFYSGDDTLGVLGLAIVNDRVRSQPAGGAFWTGSGIADVAFANVASDGTLHEIGVAQSSDDTGVCETSCTDWYGNTRPIFFGGRTFALMGSELVEVTLQSPVATIARVDLSAAVRAGGSGNG